MRNLNDDPLNECKDFKISEVSMYTGEAQPHECPICGGTRYFCGNCHNDHHEGGWGICKADHAEFASGVLGEKIKAAEAKRLPTNIRE